MKLNRKNLLLASSITLTLSAPTIHAQDGSWNVDADGNWSDATNWSGNVTANGTGSTATFGNVTTANRTITLIAPQIIGNITASDTTDNYTISGGNLTLDVTTGAPVINVVTGRTLTISSTIAGNDGLTKTGAGGLTLSGNNIYTGNTTIDGTGITDARTLLTISNNNALGSTTGVTTLIGTASAAGNGVGISLSNGVTVTGETLTIQSTTSRTSLVTAANGTAAWAGDVIIDPNSSAFIQLRAEGVNGNLTIGASASNTLTLSGNGTNFGGTGIATVLSTASGIGTLQKINTSTLVLNAANTHTGLTIVDGGANGGVVRLANSLALGNSTLELRTTGTVSALTFDSSVLSNAFTLGGLSSANATGGHVASGAKNFALQNTANASVALTVGNNDQNTTYIGVMSGAGSLGKIGNGILTLTGSNTFTGNTTISAGTLQIGAGNTTGSIANTTGVTNNAALVFNRSNDFSSTYPISGNGTVEKLGAGTLTLSGNNTYTGGTTVTAGSLKPTLATALADYTTSNEVVFNGGRIDVLMGDGTATGWSTTQVNNLLASANKTSGSLGIDTTNGNLTQWTPFTTSNFGPLGLTKLGANTTLTLNQANSYTGNTTIGAGTLRIENTGALGSSQIVQIGGNRLEMATPGNFTGPAISMQVGTIVSDRLASGPGLTHVLGNATIGNGVNTFTAGLNVANGTAAIQLDNITNNNGSTASPNLNPTTANLIITGNVTLGGGNSGTCNLTLSGNTTGNSIAGAIVNGSRTTGNVIKSGTSTWTLSGSNTYNGNTEVRNGTLLINGNASAATGNVSVGNATANGTLGGFGTVGGAVTVAAGSSIAPGASGVGILTINNTLDLSAMAAGAGQLNFELGPIAASDQIAMTGNLTISSAVFGFNDFNFSALPGLQNGNYTLITSGAVPTGTLDPADLTGTIGAGNGTLQINGSNIELVVAGISAGTPYATWSGGAGFYADANGDGVPNGMTWLLGGGNTTSNGLLLLPAPAVSGGNMTLSFKTPIVTAPAQLLFEYGTDLVTWSTPGVAVPTANSTVGSVTFTVTPANGTTNNVTLTVNGNASVAGKLFGRFNAQQ